jgi:hypothetical protein
VNGKWNAPGPLAEDRTTLEVVESLPGLRREQQIFSSLLKLMYGLRKSGVGDQRNVMERSPLCSVDTTCCSSPPLLRLSPVGDVASAVENVSAAYSDTTVALHEYFDQTNPKERIPSAK